jgi:hypothetical protein
MIKEFLKKGTMCLDLLYGKSIDNQDINFITEIDHHMLNDVEIHAKGIYQYFILDGFNQISGVNPYLISAEYVDMYTNVFVEADDIENVHDLE